MALPTAADLPAVVAAPPAEVAETPRTRAARDAQRRQESARRREDSRLAPPSLGPSLGAIDQLESHRAIW